MEEKKQEAASRERRRHYRLQFSSRRNHRVELRLTSGEVIQGTLSDFSGGGLKCLVPQKAAALLESYQFVERICVRASRSKSPLTFSGFIKRLERPPKRRHLECAIEFSAVMPSMQVPQPSRTMSLAEGARPSSAERDFLHRLQRAARRRTARKIAERQRQQEGVLEEFEDVILQLPVEDRWWFRYVLEALQHTRKNYQEGLLAEYIKLCRKSCRPAEASDASDLP